MSRFRQRLRRKMADPAFRQAFGESREAITWHENDSCLICDAPSKAVICDACLPDVVATVKARGKAL